MNNDKGQEEWARRGGDRFYVGEEWHVFYEGVHGDWENYWEGG
jgi:hypothetical protein